MSTDGAAANAARGLGQGWKVSPYILIDPGQTFTLAEIAGPGAIQQIWMTLARGKWRHTIIRVYWDDPFHDVDASNGCMHFIDRGHKDGVLPHEQPPNIERDLLMCHPDESRTVVCPIRLGSVTFHHGKTPHMTPANVTGKWRRILTQHLHEVGSKQEGDHYPWNIYVNQFTGERIVPNGVIENLPQGRRFRPPE